MLKPTEGLRASLGRNAAGVVEIQSPKLNAVLLASGSHRKTQLHNDMDS